jgi:uncharacterized protein (DUF58 family)
MANDTQISVSNTASTKRGVRITAESLRLLDAFALRAKRSFYGIRQGAHRSQRRGHGVEFAEYRKYEVGDNPRSIDWNLFSRSDKLYVKRYLEEENVALHIIIDGSRSMTHSALRVKWDTAAQIAACAAYIALATQDPVVFSVLGGQRSPRYWGARAFPAILGFLNQASSKSVGDQAFEFDLPAAARTAAAQSRFPGICLIISDFLYPLPVLHEVLRPFRARNMEIHALQILAADDRDLARIASDGVGGATLLDSESGEARGVELSSDAINRYRALLAEHCAAVRQVCLSAQISFIQAESAESSSVEQAALATVAKMGLFV